MALEGVGHYVELGLGQRRGGLDSFQIFPDFQGEYLICPAMPILGQR